LIHCKWNITTFNNFLVHNGFLEVFTDAGTSLLDFFQTNLYILLKLLGQF
jgi:hypothetical protein